MKTVAALYVLVFATIFGASQVEARDTSIVVGISISDHFGFGKKVFNEVHPFVKITKDGWTVGTHINSYSDRAWFITKRENRGQFSVDLGIVTGYEYMPIAPIFKLNYGDSWVIPSPWGVVAGSTPLN